MVADDFPRCGVHFAFPSDIKNSQAANSRDASFVAFDPFAARRESVLRNRPDQSSSIPPLKIDSDPPWLGGQAGAKAVLVAAHGNEHGIGADGLEQRGCLGAARSSGACVASTRNPAGSGKLAPPNRGAS